jgi:hypothetical protein
MTLFEILLPIIAIALVGHVSARLAIFDAHGINSLSRFSFSLLIPSLLFINTAEAEIDLGASLDLLLGYYGAVLVTYLTALLLAKSLFGYNAREQSVFAMGATYPNSTVIGIPLVLQALGEEALTPLFLIISIQNLVLFAVGTFFAERQNLSLSNAIDSLALLIRQLFRNPITLGLIAGLLVNQLSIPLPDTVRTTFRLFSSAAVPTALFVLGASLTQYRVRDQWRPALVMSIMKLLIMPLLCGLLLFQWFAIPPLWAAAGLLASAMPVGINAYAFGTRYQCGLAPVAAGTLLSALLSLITISLILLFLTTQGF